MVNSKDVARLAGVSQATVSRVLRNKSVSPGTRARVEEAMEVVGYVPDRRAQAMKTGHSNTVGVVIDDLANPFYPAMLDALTRSLELAGKSVVLWTTAGRRNDAALDAIAARDVDGVLFTTVTESSPTLQAALDRGSPLVLVHRGVDGLECDQVTTDNRRAGRMVADFLVSHGHTRFAVIGDTDVASTSRARRQGFFERLAERDLVVEPAMVQMRTFTYEFGFTAARRALTAPSPPTAIFCTNDLAAMGVVDSARALGVSIPEDLWVVGFDDIPMASWEPYRLTTVRQPIRELAVEATRLLLSRLADPAKPFVRTLLPATVVVRSTTLGQQETWTTALCDDE